jgi:tRNA (adenine22-N1)-methyltransferase
MPRRLSFRLAAVAAQVLPGRAMADVGTDHAQLPAWLVGTKSVPSAIGLDVAEGPLRVARKAVSAMGGGVEIRRSDGLDSLVSGEVHCVTICGMGGFTMVEILSRGLPRLTGLERVVLQPQGGETAVRTAMLFLGWHCVEAVLVADRTKRYVVESWAPGPSVMPWSEADIRWGRLIRSGPDPLFRNWLAQERADVELGLSRLSDANMGAHPDAAALQKEIDVIRAEEARLV